MNKYINLDENSVQELLELREEKKIKSAGKTVQFLIEEFAEIISISDSDDAFDKAKFESILFEENSYKYGKNKRSKPIKVTAIEKIKDFSIIKNFILKWNKNNIKIREGVFLRSIVKYQLYRCSCIKKDRDTKPKMDYKNINMDNPNTKNNFRGAIVVNTIDKERIKKYKEKENIKSISSTIQILLELFTKIISDSDDAFDKTKFESILFEESLVKGKHGETICKEEIRNKNVGYNIPIKKYWIIATIKSWIDDYNSTKKMKIKDTVFFRSIIKYCLDYLD